MACLRHRRHLPMGVGIFTGYALMLALPSMASPQTASTTPNAKPSLQPANAASVSVATSPSTPDSMVARLLKPIPGINPNSGAMMRSQEWRQYEQQTSQMQKMQKMSTASQSAAGGN